MSKKLAYAWLSLLGSYMVLIAIDYSLRSADGNIKVGGINIFVFWLLWAPFIVFSLNWVFSASKNLRTKLFRIMFILANAIIATIIVLMISLIYTVEFGIDSL